MGLKGLDHCLSIIANGVDILLAVELALKLGQRIAKVDVGLRIESKLIKIFLRDIYGFNALNKIVLVKPVNQVVIDIALEVAFQLSIGETAKFTRFSRSYSLVSGSGLVFGITTHA